MSVSLWLCCALIGCAFYLRTTSAKCSAQTDCFEKEICCDGRCGASCDRGSCLTDEHCDTLQGERCKQGRCTVKEALTTAAPAQEILQVLCKDTRDCGTHNMSCCKGLCTLKPSCTEECSNDQQCDITKGERCVKKRCEPYTCRHDSDCRGGETCDSNQQCVAGEDVNDANLWSREKVTGIVVFCVVGFTVTLTYVMCKKSRKRRMSSTLQGQTAASTSTTAEFVVIDMERPIPFSPDAPPSYDSLTFVSNRRNQEQESAPPCYEEAIRNSTNQVAS